MNFPYRFSVHALRCAQHARFGLLGILAVLLLLGCQNTTAPEETSVSASFARLATTTAPDSIYWTFAGKSGTQAVRLDQTEYTVAVHLNQRVAKDSLKIELRSLSITTYRLWAWAGTEISEIKDYTKDPDTIANPLLIRYDSLHKATPARYPWTHASAVSFYADLLLSGEKRFAGYPGNCPSGIQTKWVDSLLLSRMLDSKDSVGKYLAVWGVTWTPDQIKTTYRQWLASGKIRQGQYDTLFPYDDLAPRLVRPLVFTGAKDSNAIQRGTNGVKVAGSFTDDSGMTGQKIRIYSKSGDDVTMKFSINADDFPTTSQRSWDLTEKLAIKADNAPTDLYTLEVTMSDRKGQTAVGKLAFSVYPLGGVAIDSVPPGIVFANPASRNDTVADTMRTFSLRVAFSDVNLCRVVIDGDTVVAVGGVVQRLVPLAEGKATVVRIWADDSTGNRSVDSVSIYRRKAVLPVVTWNHPVTGRDSVPDTTYTYSFRWKVDGLDIDSVRIDTFSVLLDRQGIAEKSLPLKLGDTTRVAIRVVDKLRHVALDTIKVFRAASVPPSIQRIDLPKGVLIVPDTQSFQPVYWNLQDNNLQELVVTGQANPAVGRCGSVVFLKAGDTTRVSVWAKDKLGSITTDTVKVYRPDPRSPYLADIQKVQRGDSVVPLTDFVLPNIRFGRFEVTADLYAKVMQSARTTGAAGLPMTGMNIYDAMLFCNAMSKAAGLDTFYTYTARDAVSGYLMDSVRSDTITSNGTISIRKGFRLPTDNEWLAAAKSGLGVHPWGSSTDIQVVNQYAVWNTTGTVNVGRRNPTGVGLFDLAGNVAEWVYHDWNKADMGDRTKWVVRGGSYTDNLVSALQYDIPWKNTVAIGTTRSNAIGFRIVRTGKD